MARGVLISERIHALARTIIAELENDDIQPHIARTTVMGAMQVQLANVLVSCGFGDKAFNAAVKTVQLTFSTCARKLRKQQRGMTH